MKQQGHENNRFQTKPLIRRMLVLAMLGLLAVLDIAQPCVSSSQEVLLTAGNEIPLANFPEPEWLDTAEDGDETMLEPHAPMLVQFAPSGMPQATHACHILLTDQGIEPPPPWLSV